MGLGLAVRLFVRGQVLSGVAVADYAVSVGVPLLLLG